MTTIHDILNEFREAATSNRDMGDKFERLIATYLITDPLQAERFSDVWLWSEWPDRGNQPDTGIDLVAKERATGEFCAIQCKFYAKGHTVQKADIDSFFTASGKKPFTSRMIVATTEFGKHAEEALVSQHVPVQRLDVADLENSPIDWAHFSLKRPDQMKLRTRKQLRPHQKKALTNVIDGLAEAERGKMIMACGTGKTFTALKIAEQFAAGSKPWKQAPATNGMVLFLVPSIALLSQTLFEWTGETEQGMHCFAVCSDTAVGKQAGDMEDIRLHDLPFPATTDARKLATQLAAFAGKKPLTVVFSTYQSIQTIADAQKKHGAPAFDLIVCDEAHRTTGVILEAGDESNFVKVHDGKFIKASKRLYMTATPRIFSDGSKTQAEENDAVVCSMDDPALYGEELHRLGFGEAVGSGLLADYKVMVLAVDEKFVSKTFQSQLAVEGELNLDDVVKITGCWNGLSKRMARDVEGNDLSGDDAPMRRAVAFSRSIKDSKRLTDLFAGVVAKYTEADSESVKDAATDGPATENFLRCEVDHVDGTMNMTVRNRKLGWLKADTSQDGNVCRILSNARCLSEGVDVPALDSVLFLNPRNSVVDVVQSVGRVMRIAPGKKYGYIILPIGIPADVPPEEALKDNQKYKVVWQVLQALRAHDDRFNATVNKIELNKARPENIQIIGVTGAGTDDGEGNSAGAGKATQVQMRLDFPNLEEWRDAIFAKIVLKCGDRRYWESWARDVSVIAERHITRIKALLEGSDSAHRKAFEEFLKGLRTNLNPAVSEDDAIEMLAQHLITKPVFDALFEGYAFTQHNPVSKSMQTMLDLLETQALDKEQQSLEKFYASVRQRAVGIDNAQGKQKVIVELYDKFFRTAFPRMAERLGIVYTPVEVVDFIIHSADHALRQEFGVGLSDHGVHVLDPFAGTGTFMVRLLQSGLIKPEDLAHKYRNEFHANEIVLLAYYIAAINIEETYHSLAKAHDSSAGYQPFEGIVLTDTFQLNEGQSKLDDQFPENNKRAKRQTGIDIRVIVGNPPYSAGQESQNDGNQNLSYPTLDERISITYAEHSNAVLKRSLYDSYIRAVRWASDRIKDKGVVCYVSNGSFIDANNMDGLRKCLTDEFTSVYVFNLRGNQRTSGETSRREGGKIFGSGSRAQIAISLLVKNPAKQGKGQLFYHDIGDYLSREEKLKIITEFASIGSIPWRTLKPNDSHDWINQRDPAFDAFLPMGDKSEGKEVSLFDLYAHGLMSARDFWVFNFSRDTLVGNMGRMIDFYNEQVKGFKKHQRDLPAVGASDRQKRVEEFIDTDPKKISWTRATKGGIGRGTEHPYRDDAPTLAAYRPFSKQWLYFDRQFNEMVSLMPRIFPNSKLKNLVISVTGRGATKEFSALITDTLPDYEMISKGQCFPMYAYEKLGGEGAGSEDMFGDTGGITTQGEYVQRENIPDAILAKFQATYAASKGKTITKEDIFYYVYGILHSPEYKSRFDSDLKKMIPRIPFAQDFWTFSKTGRELAHWHLNYETIEPYALQQTGELDLGDPAYYQVQKMQFAKKGKEVEKTTITVNSRLRLSGIPLEAYDYIVNGKSAIEWVMERYQITVDKDSGIRNDPNAWAIESGQPDYIVNLVKRVVRVSVETVKLIKALPALSELSIQTSVRN
jgi:predicted helicase